MTKETIADLSTEEFKELMDNFIQREDDRIEPSTFLKAMEELEQQRAEKKIELTGRWENGEIIFDEPAPVPVERNTIFIGEAQVILKIREVNKI